MSTKLSEHKIIQEIQRRFADPLPRGHLGIGDDCALFPSGGDDAGWLVSTDLLAEGVHFLRNRISARDLGWKSLAVSLSDLAAKGGAPTYAFLSLALQRNTSERWLQDFLDGFGSLARMSGVILLGGDTSRSAEGCFINVVVIGQAPAQELKLRAGARPGDLVCVAGYLGDSAAGLLLQGKRALKPAEKKLVLRHHRPTPLTDLGRRLARSPAVRAMMDLSDGLDTDLGRMMTAAGTGARIEVEELPLSPELLRTARTRRWNPADLAITGGEDYGLLFTVAPEGFAALTAELRADFPTPVTRIGVIETPEGLRYQRKGAPYKPQSKPFLHF